MTNSPTMTQKLEPQQSSTASAKVTRQLPFVPRTPSPLVRSQIFNIPVEEKGPRISIILNPFDLNFPKIFKGSLERAMVGTRAENRESRDSYRKERILEHKARVDRKSVKTHLNRFLNSISHPENHIRAAPEKRLRSLHSSLRIEPVLLPKTPPPRKQSKVYGHRHTIPIPMFPPRNSANEQHHVHRWLFHRMSVSKPPLQSNVFSPSPFNPPRLSTFYECSSFGRHTSSMIFGWFSRMNYDEFIAKFPPLFNPLDPQWRDRIHEKDLFFFDCPCPPLEEYDIHILEIEPLNAKRMLGNRVSGWPPSNRLVPNKLYFIWMVHSRMPRSPNYGDIPRLRHFCRRTHRWDMYILDPTLKPYPRCLETGSAVKTTRIDLDMLLPSCNPLSNFDTVVDTYSNAESIHDRRIKRTRERVADENGTKRPRTGFDGA